MPRERMGQRMELECRGKTVTRWETVSGLSIEREESGEMIVPDACPDLRFTVEGPGRIIGAGNGDPSYTGPDHPANPKDFTYPAFNGFCRVYVQSDGGEGEIVLMVNNSYICRLKTTSEAQ